MTTRHVDELAALEAAVGRAKAMLANPGAEFSATRREGLEEALETAEEALRHGARERCREEYERTGNRELVEAHDKRVAAERGG